MADEDIEFINVVTTQSAVILGQSRLYKLMAQQAEREKLVREVVSAISSTLDYDKIRHLFVSRLGDILDADISALYMTDPQNK